MSLAQPQFKLAALRRRNELLCRIDLWGFVSLMMMLFFVLWVDKAAWTDLPMHSVDLPAAHHSMPMPNAEREDALHVKITRDGEVRLGDFQITSNDLPNLIRERLHQGAEKKIYVSADARTKYSNVVAVLEEIRLAGINKVAFLTN